MSLQAEVGVIVLNWNGWDDTQACLESLFVLTGVRPRLYVVDNASADGSPEKLAAAYGGRITLIQNRENLLYAGGNNAGLLRALADGCSHLLLLNNDTVVDPQLITELLRAAEREPQAILCPKIYYADRPETLWYAGGRIALRRARISHRGIRELDRGQYDRMEETGWATGCALFGPRAVFETVGLLDESFQLYSEDVDYCLRARRAGFRIVYVPAAKVWHKVSASLGGNLARGKLVRKWNSLRRLLRKHLPNPLLRILALTDFLITEPLRVTWAALRGRLS